MFKTTPYAHQLAEFELSRDLKARALFWEMGCGKTKPTIDTAAHLVRQCKIRGLLVLAPKAVAPNWVYDELPTHLPDDVAAHTRVLLWQTERANTQTYQREIAEALEHPGFLVVVMSYDGIMTGDPKKAFKVRNIKRAYKGCHYARQLLTSRPCMFVLDESARIKDPNSKRTKRVLAAGQYAPYKRVLTGTPVPNSPFDVFAQLKFLDLTVWDSIGCRSFSAFKQTFGNWVERLRNPSACKHRDPDTYEPYLNPATGEPIPCNCPTFQKLVKYVNLDSLHEHVDKVGSRLLKDDVLDLPPKQFEKRYFELSKEQQKLYDELRRDFMVLLDNGDMITAPLVITQLLRLQQVTSGYCPTDDGDTVLLGDNPRLPLLVETVLDCPHKVIVWAKFKHDVQQIVDALRAARVNVVRYDGSTSPADRELARNGFQKGDAQVFVGNPACAGEGLTLHAAKTVIYYNTSFKLGDRLQSEDRAHRAGMDDRPVTYIDIIAERTVDEKIVRALREKKNLAELVMGDSPQAWI